MEKLLIVLIICSLFFSCSNIFDSNTNKYFDNISGYVALDWKPESIPDFKKFSKYLSEVNPVWYSIESDGFSIRKNVPQHYDEIINESIENNLRVIPLISNSRNGWQPEWVESMITDPNKRYKHIENIYSLVNNSDIDGIEIDYEMISAVYRDQFSVFIEELSEKLHSINKIINIAVHAKTTSPGHWYGSIAQDWNRIGNAADVIKVMAYNFRHKNSDPGPIAPIGWVRDIINNVLTDVLKDKIVIGIAGYGIDWNITDSTGNEKSYTNIRNIINSNNIKVNYDSNIDFGYEIGKIPNFSYTNNGKQHIIWYENQISTAEKINLVKSFGLKGISIWVMGYEDPKLWDYFDF